jgi:hypothetical protein
MAEMREHLVEDTSQLGRLKVLSWMPAPGQGTIRLGGAMAHMEQREYWESELNRHYFACGCEAGATGVIIGLVLGSAFVVMLFVRGSALAVSWESFLAVPGTAIVGAVGGKLYGLLRAQRRLRGVVRQIQEATRPFEANWSDAPQEP